MPAGRGHLARLVEDAALRAAEGERLVGVDLAALEALAARCRPHDVVTAILVDGHAPFWRTGRAAVASPAVDSSEERGERRPERPPQDAVALERGPLGHRPHRLWGSPRASTSGSASRRSSRWRPTSGSKPMATGDDPDHAGGLVQEWMDTVGKGVPGYVTPKVAVGAAVGNDEGRAAADPAGRFGDLALPHGLVRRRLLGRRGGGEGGGGGDRHRRRARPPHRRARRPAPRLHPGPALLAPVLLPRHRRRAGAAPARDPRRRLVHPRHAAAPARRLGALGRARLRRHQRRAPRRPLRQRAPPDVARRVHSAGGRRDLGPGRRVGGRRPGGGGDRPAAAALALRAAAHAPSSWRASSPTRTPRCSCAEDDGRIVGTLTLAAFEIPTGRRAWIEDVVTDTAARGKGVASALVDAALAHAASIGAARSTSRRVPIARTPTVCTSSWASSSAPRTCIAERSTPAA